MPYENAFCNTNADCKNRLYCDVRYVLHCRRFVHCTAGYFNNYDWYMQLSDGLKEFNEQGVQKLVDAVDGNLTGLITRLRATIDVSKNYRSFSGIDDSMDGQVKFIYRTDAIES